ncbi:MAG: aspartate dehydrogenase [Candidatus Micrarchaeota archaeon]|nr:aspartate dehydrogenase [Candidatus Micrarchaeota archaeon]
MKIGLVGLGAIGSHIAKKMKEKIAWVVDVRDVSKTMKKIGLKCPLFAKLPKKCGGVELVIEAANQKAVGKLAGCLKYSDLMILSVGALAKQKILQRVEKYAEKYGHRVLIPSGAIGGLDAIAAVAAEAREVVLETAKPPHALGRADAFRTVVFEGNAKDACRLFPQNVNVAATLALAGVGFKKTKVRIISDPGLKSNVHRITVAWSGGRMEFLFDNLAFKQNPKTSALAAYSVIEKIEKQRKRMQIG